MISFFKFKNSFNWRYVGPYACTLALTVSLNSSWRAPRDAFRYGGLTSTLLNTATFVGIALPVVLLQLAVGQLSQQDAVGIWRAVPFFQGIGYLRLLTSNTLPFLECSELPDMASGDTEVSHNTSCLNDRFLAPINEQPEYYIALAFIVIVLWILFPFILYNPVKLMKKILYVITPLILVLGITIVSSIGNRRNITFFHKIEDWKHFIRPNIWHEAIAQALLSSQTAGGFLISSGDSIYANINVQWTTILIVSANLVTSLLGMIFWFAISGREDNAKSNIAVLVQIYKTFMDNNLNTAWPMLTFLLLTLSGAITMLTFLYPLYDRFQRMGGYKWRHISIGSSLIGAISALSVLFIGQPAFTLLEDIVVPFFLSIATVLEVSVFAFIYGWKILVADIEFLIENRLVKYWVLGWCAVPGIIMSFTLWWSIYFFIEDFSWTQAPWGSSSIIACVSATIIIILTCAAFSVAKQVQYDFLGKLKSSFKPSRHWGPRDPITHHYWLARREESNENAISTRYRMRRLGQFSGNTSCNDVMRVVKIDLPQEIKRRSNSDDWLVVYRKKHVAQLYQEPSESRKRSKSLDWNPIKTIVELGSGSYFHDTN